MKYIILEIQISDTVATLVSTADNYNQARSIWHEKLALAAISSVPKHTVVLIDENGDLLGQESYKHEEATNG